MRKLILAAAITFAAALPAAAQVTHIGSPIDPGFSFIGPIGPAASGGIPTLAQTFMTPAGFNWLQSFSVYLGDNYSDGSGVDLVFQAAVYEVNAGVLGNQLYLSSAQNGSPNFSNTVPFDTYTFATPNLFLNPSVGTFALVLQTVSNQNGALNVIAAGSPDYANGEIFVVNSDNSLTTVDGTTDAAFDATLTTTATPEPATLVLFASGLALVGGFARRRYRV